MTKGFKYRMGVRIWNVGIRLRVHWIMLIGDNLRRKGLNDYV